jgi:carbon-monoxide dehydrogenase medium subunit
VKNFAYREADSKDAILAALAELKDAYVIAGGTNVMLNILDKKVNDRTLVNLRNAKELRGIKDNGETITIGATTTISDLEHSELIAGEAKALWQAAVSFADPTTRHSATVGGNISNASPAADTATALMVLDAVVTIEKKGAKREVALTDFFKGVGKTVLAADEIVTAITFKKSHNCAFIKLGLRNAMAISVANVAVNLVKQGDVVKDIKIAMGSVAPTVRRCAEVEKALLGKKLEDAVIAEAVKGLDKDISPIDDIRATGKYRKQVAPVLVTRAIYAACGCKDGGAK